MDSFQAETTRDKPKKRNKNFVLRSRFYPKRAREFPKIKNQKSCFISSRNRSEQAENERKKFPHSIPIPSFRIPKKMAKKF